MKIEKDVPLHNLTTFKIGGKASYFALVGSVDTLKEAIVFAQEKKLPWFVLGGGSNILLNDEGFDGLVIKNEILGKDIVDAHDGCEVTVGAGENWDAFVAYCVDKGLYGVENLSSIPGTVGAAPVQNIGAYGAEVKDVIKQVEVFDTETLELRQLSNSDCHFEYRDSFFKTSEGKKYIIVHVTFSLQRNGTLKTDYKDIRQYFDSRKISPTLETVRLAVIEIRKGKFPDLSLFGTAGSFFKNPIIPAVEYARLKATYPDIPKYDVGSDQVKIPLAWVLDNICNLKGVRNGNVGQYEKQALVLINFGGATSAEVKQHAEEIMLCVKEKTGITIEPEVEWVD